MSRQIIKKLKTTLYYSLLAVGISLPASLSSAAAAGSASFSLTPGGGTFNVGDYLTVEIRENSGATGINFVQPKLVYDAGVLSFQSIDTSQSPFTSAAGPVPTPNGLVDLSRGIVGTDLISSDTNIAFVTFKITGAASASSMSFSSTSSIRSAVADSNSPSGVTTTEEWNGITNGATFTFKGPVVTTPPPSGGVPSSGGGTTSSSGKSSGAKTTTVAGASSTPPATVTLAPAPSSDGSDDGALLQSDHMVSIKVVNSKDKPIVGAEVKLGTETTHTLSDGTASFVAINDGKYTITVTYKGKTTTQEITVNGQGQPGESIQNFKVKLASSSAIPTWIIYTGGAVLLVFLVSFFIPRRRHGMGDFSPASVSIKPVVVGNMAKKAEVAPPVQAVQPIAPPPPPAPVAPTPAPPTPPPASSAKPVAPGSVFAPENNPNKDQQ
jgi:hypothetical protein